MSSKSQPNRVTIQEFKPEEIPMSCTWIIVGPPGSGKCLGKGTEVLMYDGSIKRVEEIENHDVLMGDDSLPRIVRGVASGKGKLYKIEQSFGDTYVVNAPHILVLRKQLEPRKYYDEISGSWKVEWFKDGKRSWVGCYNEERADSIKGKLTPGVDYDAYKTIEIEAETYYERVQALNFPTSSSTQTEEDDILDYKGYKAPVKFQKGKVSEEERLTFLGKLIDATDSVKSNEYYTIITRNDRLADKIKLVADSLCFHATLTGDVVVSVKDTIKTEDKSDVIEDQIAEQNEVSDAIQEQKDEPIETFTEETSSTTEESSEIPKIVITGSSSSSEVSPMMIPTSEQKMITLKSDKGEVLNTEEVITYRIDIRGDISRIPVSSKREELVSIKSDSDIKITQIEDGEWFGFEIDNNKRFLLRDLTVTHNTTFIENMMYMLKDRYPVGTAFIGTEGAYERFCQVMHPLYVRPRYDEAEERSHILRQKTCAIENGGRHPANYAINILDDVSDDPKIYKTNVMRGLFKLGAQHWHQLLMVGSQYAIDMPPDVRKSVSYVAIFMEPEDQERRKLYNNFGGLAGSYENFCDLMDQITGDYTCLIFKKRTQTQSLEENIFWFRGRQLPMWKFGCKEYRKWAEERFDKDYIEEPQV